MATARMQAASSNWREWLFEFILASLFPSAIRKKTKSIELITKPALLHLYIKSYLFIESLWAQLQNLADE